MRIPLPPPPAVAFKMTGYFISAAIFNPSSTLVSNPSEPGMVGTPAFFIVSFALLLSPIPSICSGVAPMNFILFLAQIALNFEFSDKNPYPGCMASELVISAAAIMLGIFRYESLLGGGPIQTASSAKRTCRLSRSAVE